MTAIRWLLKEAFWPKALRFGLVGGLSTLAYGIFTLIAVESAGLPPLAATLVGYLFVIPLNFFLQRSFTFRAEGSMKDQVPRFLWVHGMNMGGSWLAMYAVTHWLHIDYRWGILATMMLVPVFVFIAMDLWVFRKSGGDPKRRPPPSDRPV